MLPWYLPVWRLPASSALKVTRIGIFRCFHLTITSLWLGASAGIIWISASAVGSLFKFSKPCSKSRKLRISPLFIGKIFLAYWIRPAWVFSSSLKSSLISRTNPGMTVSFNTPVLKFWGAANIRVVVKPRPMMMFCVCVINRLIRCSPMHKPGVKLKSFNACCTYWSKCLLISPSSSTVLISKQFWSSRSVSCTASFFWMTSKLTSRSGCIIFSSSAWRCWFRIKPSIAGSNVSANAKGVTTKPPKVSKILFNTIFFLNINLLHVKFCAEINK